MFWINNLKNASNLAIRYWKSFLKNSLSVVWKPYLLTIQSKGRPTVHFNSSLSFFSPFFFQFCYFTQVFYPSVQRFELYPIQLFWVTSLHLGKIQTGWVKLKIFMRAESDWPGF